MTHEPPHGVHDDKAARRQRALDALNKRPVTAGRRTGRPGRLDDAYRTLAAVEADDRFRALSVGARFTLLTALVAWADGRGSWFVNKATWAKRIGVDDKTIQRHVSDFEQRGLVTVSRWHRPPGTSAGGRQGGNTYQLNAALVHGETPVSGPVEGDTSVRAPRGDTHAPAAGPDTSVSAERGSNGTFNEGLCLIGQCFNCGTHGPVIDDGTRELCVACRNAERNGDAA